jgi:chaperonin GroES
MINFQPMNERLFVKRSEAKEKTKGGLLIPDSAKEKPVEGEVVAVGKGALSEDGKHVACQVKKGDRILFGKWSGTEFQLEGEDYIVLKEEDILGICH